MSCVHEIHCIGKDGEVRTFWAKVENHEIHEDEIVQISVYLGEACSGDKFSFFEFHRLPHDAYRSHHMDHNHHAEFSAQGIPEEVLLNAPRWLVVSTIVSSRCGGLEDEFISKDAKKVWERLKARGLAQFDKTQGRYVLSNVGEE